MPPIASENKLVDHSQFSMSSVYFFVTNDSMHPNWLESFILK